MMEPNALYYGDCLEVMQEFPDSCIDLIYLDPPFNSKTDYNCFFPNPDTGKIKNGGGGGGPSRPNYGVP